MLARRAKAYSSSGSVV